MNDHDKNSTVGPIPADAQELIDILEILGCPDES
jgi:hypothetical protein